MTAQRTKTGDFCHFCLLISGMQLPGIEIAHTEVNENTATDIRLIKPGNSDDYCSQDLQLPQCINDLKLTVGYYYTIKGCSLISCFFFPHLTLHVAYNSEMKSSSPSLSILRIIRNVITGSC